MYSIIKKAAKKAILHSYKNNYILFWDAECESLYRTVLQSCPGDNSSLVATALFAKLGIQTDLTIDVSHSSGKAWSILNNLTSKSSPYHCLVSADAIASQLVRN